MSDGELDFFFEEDEDDGVCSKREECPNCFRPKTVCICAFFPETKIVTRTRVIIVQHPKEQKRKIRTVPLLEKCIDQGTLLIVRKGKVRSLEALIPPTWQGLPKVLLFPGGRESKKIMKSLSDGEGIVMIALDGTWSQAQKMYDRSPVLHCLPRVELPSGEKSSFAVRMQPAKGCLSTAEAVAFAVDALDGEVKGSLVEAVRKPLEAMVSHQIKFAESNGADYLERWDTVDRKVSEMRLSQALQQPKS
mmetsp:Transcript_31116/g.81662  ORF Transcript_31116/g.81662 Transcript_31116/m.81662 type:complete len:248 (-) Transcript_31116:657-1400(-)